MLDKVEKFVEKTEELGNDFIDYIIIPFIRGTKHMLLDEAKINYFLKFKTEYLEQKITLFISYLKENNKDELIDFVNTLKNKDKEFFILSINKVFELDNSLQLYILAYLTKMYQQNSSLNYFEKSIYYNIEQLSEDDLKIFSELMFKLKPSENNQKAYPLSKNKLTEIENIVLIKFTNIGIIQTVNGGFGGPFITKTEYSDKLALIIKEFIDKL
jgi:hypothetical protein